jgi:ABC-2 type transport system ATP-binding protein
LCDRIAIIHRGEIIQDLPKKQLLSLLNVETFILDLAKPLTKTLPELTGCEIRQKDSVTLQVVCHKTQNMNTVFEFLSAHDVIVSSMRNEMNRLEELFLKLTKS